MKRIPFVLRMDGADRAEAIEMFKTLKDGFEAVCRNKNVVNFSAWHMEQYLFVYAESMNDDASAFDEVLNRLPAELKLVSAPGTMRLMYSCIGTVQDDKSGITHRVFSTKIKPGCEEEYKHRHDVLTASRKGVYEGPDSNFTIWYGDGHIFGYDEKINALIKEPTEEEQAFTVAWETRQLEIMDWLTDDVDWLTGEKHAPVERIL